MVGEIRDKETLDMAMESAMTGHLVFSTVHTNSSAETITRVYNLGAKPYMLAGTFNLVMAQRLARRVCQKCKVQVNIKDSPQYIYAKESFKNYDEDALRREIAVRKITQKQRDDFMIKGLINIGSGKDPQTKEVCEHCG